MQGGRRAESGDEFQALGDLDDDDSSCDVGIKFYTA